MVNGCELLINLVRIDVPKLLFGHEPKGVRLDNLLMLQVTSSSEPPGNRQNLSRSCDMSGTW